MERVGKHCPVVWDVKWSNAKNIKNTIHGGIYWLPIGKLKHNNQPKTGGRNGGENVGDIQPAGCVGEALCHRFGGIVRWIGGKNIK